jgi:predicted helicase
LHGYELLMAPYAIAHLKIGLKLHETGYRFGSDERARIYLTNALEPAHDFSERFEFAIPALAHEAQAVNEIKRHQKFTVVIGNPPYSGRSWNLTPELRRLVESYRFVEGQRIKEKGALQLEKSIQEDYVKFFRCGELHVMNSGIGILGLVTSHGFLDNPFLRGMRSSVMSTFSHLFILDLHGNALRKEQSPDGAADKNVFDIKKTGIAISLFRRLPSRGTQQVEHADLWGVRDAVKYPWLIANSVLTTPMTHLVPRPVAFLFVPQDYASKEEYELGYSIADIMAVNSKGIVTGRDAFVIDFDEEELLARMCSFVDPRNSDETLIKEFGLNPSDWWNVSDPRRSMPPKHKFGEFVRPLLYRPFDIRPCFYHPPVLMSPRRPVMKHMDHGEPNLLLVTSRMTKGEEFQHVTVADGLAEAILLSSKTSNNAIIFPLYLYPDVGRRGLGLSSTRQVNISSEFLRGITEVSGLWVVDGRSDCVNTVRTEEVFRYIVAILHSPRYRARYSQFLKGDFPRIPLPGSLEVFRELAQLGGELVADHLLKSPKLDHFITTYIGPKNPEVGRVGWSADTVWLDIAATKKGQPAAAGTIGFRGLPEAVWNFRIGGYQVCEKWLKDRKGRTLSDDDIAHYQKIVAALAETIRLMGEIDEVIERYGGWPNAFAQGQSEPSEDANPDNVLPLPRPKTRTFTHQAASTLQEAAEPISPYQPAAKD